MTFWLFVVDQVRLILHEQAGNFCFVAEVGILFDELLPFDGFLERVGIGGGADDDAAFVGAEVPRAPRRYILETALKRY
jgi:hypothetical protein